MIANGREVKSFPDGLRPSYTDSYVHLRIVTFTYGWLRLVTVTYG